MADPHTHYIAAFSARNAAGEQRSICGRFIASAQHSTEPSCWGCKAWLEGQGDEPQPARRLTRYEQLQALADSGFDTWQEARGER